jgi:hypothetical protein
MTSAERAYGELCGLVDAAGAVLENWDSALDQGYPARLPSFDEFYHELIDWKHAASRAVEASTPREVYIASHGCFYRVTENVAHTGEVTGHTLWYWPAHAEPNPDGSPRKRPGEGWGEVSNVDDGTDAILFCIAVNAVFGTQFTPRDFPGR